MNVLQSPLKRLILLFPLLSFFAHATALTQQPTPSNLPETSASDTQTNSDEKQDIEVIGVEGQYPLLYFKKQVEKAELNFYDAYNALVDNDEFKMQCRRDYRVGSRLRQKSCYPQYVLTRMAKETEDALISGGRPPTFKDIDFLVKEEKAQAMAYVEKLMTENPELMQKLLTLNEKQATYESEKKKRN